jgi:hypothetical protein
MPSHVLFESMRPRSRNKRAEGEAWSADEALLVERLRGLGIDGPVKVHENRTVLVSFADRSGLRIHRGYAYASDRTLRAVVAFVHPYTRRAKRKKAELEVTSFPVDNFVAFTPARRHRGRVKPADRQMLARLRELHEQLNTIHFQGSLSPIAFRISDRMRTRLGELTIDPDSNESVEIGISRRHLESDDWSEIVHTVLHEMIHQWQAEQGFEIDHGEAFRRKASEVGVLPRAIRDVRARQHAARYN